MKNIKKCQVLGVLLTLLLASTSMGVAAMPITGGLELTGGLQLLKADGVTTTQDITEASKIDFIGGIGIVQGTSGSFMSITDSLVDIMDIDINPFEGPLDPFWSLATSGFTFSLESLVNVDPAPDGIAFLLEGSGTIKHASYDDTAGFWTLSADTLGVRFSWNASTGAVPEPSTLLLLGIGFIGMGFTRVRRRA